MLLGLGSFVLLDEADDLGLPRVGKWAARFIRNLVQHVVEIVHGVDDLLHVGLLNVPDLIRHLRAVGGAVLRTINIIDVVGGPIRITIDRIGFKLQLVTIEEHDGNIDTILAGRNRPGPHAVKIALVEFGEVESQSAVVSPAGTAFSATSRGAPRCFHPRHWYPPNPAAPPSTAA